MIYESIWNKQNDVDDDCTMCDICLGGDDEEDD